MTSVQNGTTIPTTGELVVTTCWCGIQYAVPAATMRWHRQAEANGIYCPLGHRGVVRETDAVRLQRAEARERHLEDQLSSAGAEAERVRAQMMRDRQRYANGVCPCCNRSFVQLARHMATQHPDYDPSHLAEMAYRCSCGRSFASPHGLRIHQSRKRDTGWAAPSTPKWRAHLTVAG